MTRLYIFDLDGTLVDSLRDLSDTANALVMSCGGAALDMDAVGRMVGEGVATLVSRVFSAAGVDQPSDAVDRFLTMYETRLLNHTRSYDGMVDVLSELSARASLAVLTNKPCAATNKILEGLGLSRFFAASNVVGGDGPLPRKPNPAGLTQLCSQAAVAASDALLVGDSLVDWETARNGGAAICLARYGFGFRQFPRTVLNGRECFIDQPRDLLAL